MKSHFPTPNATDREGFGKINGVPNAKDNENSLDDVYHFKRDEETANLYQYAPERPRSVALRGKFVYTDGSDLNENENEASQTQVDDEDQRFDELDDFDSYEIGENDLANKGHGTSDLNFSYEALAKEADELQRKYMILSQENSAMKRDIKIGALIRSDLYKDYVGSTPYYPNRGRGQGFRGRTIRGRQTTQGHTMKTHRSWSPTSKKGTGNINTIQQWRPKTPPADNEAHTTNNEAHATLELGTTNAPTEIPNGNKPDTTEPTVSRSNNTTNVTVEVGSGNGLQ